MTTNPKTSKAAVIGVASTCEKNTNHNTGNMLHAESARRIMGDYKGVPTATPWDEAMVERIESEHTHIGVILANAIRIGAETSNVAPFHRTMRENIEKTKLPVVVFGLGSQALSRDRLVDPIIPDETRALVRVLGERSKAVAVRGEMTATVLENIGVKNARVLGCQSCFYHLTPEPNFEIKTGAIGERVAFSYTGLFREINLVKMAHANNWDTIGQEHFNEEAATDGNLEAFEQELPWQRFFRLTGIEQRSFITYLNQHFRKFYSIEEWFERMQDYDFCFGTRFHGGMTALQCGVPALWVTHDVRTEELCNYLGLPRVPLAVAKEFTSIEQFVERVDYSNFHAKYKVNHQRWVDYLNEAGLDHNLKGGSAGGEARTESPAVASGKTGSGQVGAGNAVVTKQTIQLRTNTSYDRYPNVFAKVAGLVTGKDAKILSFGCSRGEEAMALADKYFTLPQQRIVGVDVNRKAVAEAVASNKYPERVNFFLQEDIDLAKEGPFDAVFAMSVLCSWPDTRDFDDCSKFITFGQFEKIVEDLASLTAVGGHLVIFNANFLFSDTKVSRHFKPVDTPVAWGSGFVKKFGTDNKAINPDLVYPHSIFEKVSQS